MPQFITGSAAPGVHVNINTAQVGRISPFESSDVFMAVGYSPWGAVNQATYVTGIADYARQFGGLNANSNLGNALNLFFREGGTVALVVRVVGGAAAVATHTYNDRAGTPLATLRIDAKYPSTSKRVYATIEAGTLANTVKLTFRSPDLPLPTEIWDNVKLTLTQSESDAIASNQSALTTIAQINDKSNLVKLTNLNSATVAPNNLPALVAETLLTGGNDDFAGLSAASYIGTDDGTTQTGLQVLNTEEFGPGQVALPGVTTTAAHLALAAHALAYKRFAILDLAPGSTKDDAITERRLLDSSYAALYFPPTLIAYDLAGSGVKKNYPLSGAIAGVFARAEHEIGVHKAPANYQLFTAIDVERNSAGTSQTNEATRALLNSNQVNVVTPLSEEGIKVYGARVLTNYGLVSAIHEQRVINQAYYELKKSYRSLVFGVLDASGRIFREAKSISEQYLREIFRAGALTSTTGKESDSFVVLCDLTNNPPDSLAQHLLNVDIGMHIVGMAEMIFVTINSVPLSTSLADLNAQ
jgi:uncharacterized protein